MTRTLIDMTALAYSRGNRDRASGTDHLFMASHGHGMAYSFSQHVADVDDNVQYHPRPQSPLYHHQAQDARCRDCGHPLPLVPTRQTVPATHQFRDSRCHCCGHSLPLVPTRQTLPAENGAEGMSFAARDEPLPPPASTFLGQDYRSRGSRNRGNGSTRRSWVAGRPSTNDSARSAQYQPDSGASRYQHTTMSVAPGPANLVPSRNRRGDDTYYFPPDMTFGQIIRDMMLSRLSGAP